jgi:hypothetical protein
MGGERASQQLKYRNKEVKGGKQFYEDVKLIVDDNKNKIIKLND